LAQCAGNARLLAAPNRYLAAGSTGSIMPAQREGLGPVRVFGNDASGGSVRTEIMNWTLEVVVVPVSDVDRS